MLSRLAVFTVRRPKVILVAVLALLGISVVFGGAVTEKLGVGGFVDPAAESSQVADYLDQNFPTTPNLVLQVVARERRRRESRCRGRRGSGASSSSRPNPRRRWSDRSARRSAADLRSRDGRSGLILVHVGGTLDEATKAAIRIIEELADRRPGGRRACRRPPGRVGGDRGPGQSRSRHQREHRAAHLARRARDRLRRSRCRPPAPRHRHHVDRHDTAGAGDHGQRHRCLGARAHCRNGIRPRACPSTSAC